MYIIFLILFPPLQILTQRVQSAKQRSARSAGRMRARNTDADEVETVRKTCVVYLRDLEYKNLLLLLDAYKDILLVDGFLFF